MISNFVCCCDCEYQDFCHHFDAFFGCIEGKPRNENDWPMLCVDEEYTHNMNNDEGNKIDD